MSTNLFLTPHDSGTTLDLRYKNLTDEKLDEIYSYLQRKEEIVSIDLRDNFISEKGVLKTIQVLEQTVNVE